MKIISIVNQKGGVAKTTSTQNIAYGLSQLNKKVLVIDFDPQGNLTSGFGIDKRNLEKTIYDLLKSKAFPSEKAKIEDVLIKKDKLDIIPTNIKMSKINIELGGIPGRDNLLKELLKELLFYDYILIDCPPSLDTLTFNALTASDEIFIPVQTEYYALEGIVELMDTIEVIKQRLNEKLRIGGVIATMVDTRIKLHNEIIEQLNNFFEKKMFTSYIRRNIKISEASSYGKTIFEYDNKSNGAIDYENLCKEIIEREV